MTPEPVLSKDVSNNASALLDAIWNDDAPPQPPQPPVEEPAKPPEQPAAPSEPKPEEPPDVAELSDGLELPDEFFQPEAKPDVPAPPLEGEEDSIPQGMDDKQRHAFEQLAFDRRELKRQNAENQKKISDLEERANSTSVAESETLQGKIEALEDRLGQYNLAETAAFKKEFDVPYQERVARVYNLLIRSQLDKQSASNLLNKALQTADLNSRIDMLNEEVPHAAGMLGVILDEVDSIRTRRAETLKRWKEHKASIDETQKREQQRETLVMSEKLTKQAIEQAALEGNFMYRKAKDSETWNQEVDGRVQAAAAVLRKGDKEEMARYIVDGLAGRRLREMFVVERQKRVTAEQQIGAIRGARPGVAGAGSAGVVAGKKDERSTDQILTDIWQTSG